MKLIDRSLIPIDPDPIKKVIAQVKGSLKYGFDFTTEMQAQEEVIALLRTLLDNRYTLIRNLTLEGLAMPIPMILVGPAGLSVLCSSGVKGVFRAKSESWSEMNPSTKQYAATRNNLVARTQLMAKVIDTYLTGLKRAHPEIQPVLLLTNPGAHVETVRPVVRVVQRDALERFITSYSQGPDTLDAVDAQRIVEGLVPSAPKPEEKAKTKDIRDSFSMVDEKPAARPKPKPQAPVAAAPSAKAAPRQAPKVVKQIMGFSVKQWIILGGMALFFVLLLLGFIALIFIQAAA
jgi:hypothetical protein